MSRYKFKVLRNDVLIDTGIPGTLKAAKFWIKHSVISTHMGHWKRIPGGYEYCTTIGAYYKFIYLRQGE